MSKIYQTEYTVQTNKTNCKIVLISDLHYYQKKDLGLLNRISQQIQFIKPDYICIPGDFCDEGNVLDKQVFLDWLESLAQLCKVILSVGNHDVVNWKNGIDPDLLKDVGRIANVELLDNRSYETKDIRFIGLTLPQSCYHEQKNSISCAKETIEKVFPKKIPGDKFNLLLAHSPYLVVDSEIRKLPFMQNIDLTVSGHTHAGLTPYFLCQKWNRVLITPMRKPFPKNSYGYLKKYQVIVSAGVVKLSHTNFLRNFNCYFSSEIVILNLTK